MIGRSYRIPRGDESALRCASGALRDWEPLWEIDVPPPDARLYDADTTVYGVCLGAMTVPYNHRTERAERGDLLIVPRALALDVEPEVDILALRHAGDPPDHFRERFIQVWGFERLGADRPTLATEGDYPVITVDDPRYPLSYSLKRGEGVARGWSATGHTAAVLIVIEGRCTVIVRGESPDRQALAAGDAMLVGPGLEFAAEAHGLLAGVTLFTALDHEARRDAATRRGRAPGPEFDPAAQRRSKNECENRA